MLVSLNFICSNLSPSLKHMETGFYWVYFVSLSSVCLCISIRECRQSCVKLIANWEGRTEYGF